MKTLMLTIVVAGLLPTSVFALCFEPSAPYCASSYGPFDSEWEFDSCRRDMDTYLDELQEHVQCVQDDAMDQYQDAVDSFNRRAGG